MRPISVLFPLLGLFASTSSAATLSYSEAAPAAPRLFVAPAIPGGLTRLALEGGQPGGVVRVLAAPVGSSLDQAHMVVDLDLDEKGCMLTELSPGLGGLDLWGLVRSQDLVFGPVISAKLSLPLAGEASASRKRDSGELVVSEILKDPSAVSDSKGEWVEFFNTTNQDINIEGWVLSDLCSDATVLDNGGAGIIIPARGYGVVAKEADPAVNGGLIPAGTYGGFTLSNGEDEVVLSRPNGKIIDAAAYDDGTSWPDQAGATLQLSNVRLSPVWNDEGENWCAAVQPYGDGDLGTPGAKNDDC